MRKFWLTLFCGLLVVGVATGHTFFLSGGGGHRGNGELGAIIQISDLFSEPVTMILLGLSLIGLTGYRKSRLEK
jgi:hypothetical protein